MKFSGEKICNSILKFQNFQGFPAPMNRKISKGHNHFKDQHFCHMAWKKVYAFNSRYEGAEAENWTKYVRLNFCLVLAK